MRGSHLVLSLLCAGAAGCGGSSNASIDAPPPIDALACAQRGTVNATAPLDFSQGGKAEGTVPSSGTQLSVSALIFNNAAPSTGLLIIQVNNGGVFSAAAGKAGRFETPPAPGTYPLDDDANLGFGIDFVNGITRGAAGTQINPTQVALLDPAGGGTVRIDSWTPAATPGGTSTIAATITNAKFKGFNVISGTTLDPAGNGCDIMIQNLQFVGLGVQWQAAAFPAAGPPGPPASLAAPQPVLGPQAVAGAAVVSADLRIE